jgi:integrase
MATMRNLLLLNSHESPEFWARVTAALRRARQNQAARRTKSWPKVCICGECYQLLFTTSTGHPIGLRNLKRSFDARGKKAGVRQIKIHDTRRTCGSLLAIFGRELLHV